MDRHYFSALAYSVFILSPALDRSVHAMPYTTESVQSGIWTDLSRIENRADFSLDSAIVSIHAFAADQRSSEFERPLVSGISLEERLIGTRLAYGQLHAVGLPARLADPLGKTLPSAYGRLRSDYRLDTGASGAKPAAAFASFSPKLPAMFELATGFMYEPEKTLSGIVSFGIIHAIDKRLRLDVFSEKALLPSRVADAWFSVPPPLPRREQELFAISTSAALPFFSATFDLAWSDQHFSGKGWHFGGTTSARKDMLLVDIATDYTTSRFTDTEGTSRGSGLRAFIETKYKSPSATFSLGFDAAGYDSLALKDTVKLKFAYVASDTTGKNSPKTPHSPFRLKSVATETQVTEEDIGTWIPSFQFRMNHFMDKASWSEKVGIELIPLGFSIESFSCGVDATLPIEIRRRSESGSAELKASIAMKTRSTESPVFSGRLGLEWKVKGGGVRMSFGTDDPASVEELLASLEKSDSAFGPWTASLSWRFEERSPSPTLVR